MLNQNFPVIYKSKQFMVDPIYLGNASRKFKDLTCSFSNKMDKSQKMKLEIIHEHFSERNIENFLKLCQNIPTDCQNSEIKEICEIAKMFQADQIYNTGLNFIHDHLDSNFNVSDTKYVDSEGSSFLVISPIIKKPHHFSDISSLEFEDDFSQPISNQENINPNVEISKDSEKVPSTNQEHSVVYRIKASIPQLMKRPLIQFISNGQVIYSAKRKNKNVVIGEGKIVHINKDRKNHVGMISMQNGINFVNCENQSFKIKYIYLTGPKIFSIETEFLNKGSQIHWKPIMPKYNSDTDSYTMPLRGEYNRASIKSVKNTALVNDNEQLCFICRKIENDDFEIECNPKISPLIAFSIALCQIIGPDSTYHDIVKM